MSNLNNLHYNKLSEEERKAAIEEHYSKQNYSFPELAEAWHTYPNKLRRDAIKFGIPVKSKSEAQSIALKSGRHKHPTKGTTRSDEIRVKISEKISETLDHLDDETKKARAENARQIWNARTAEEQEIFRAKSTLALRKAAKEGSKLEKYLYEKLKKAGHIVEYHKEHLLKNFRMHLDMLIPKLSVAIEIDGPSHFEPVWGDDSFKKTQAADKEKNGLLLSAGMVIIRVKHDKQLSAKFKRDVWNALSAELDKIKKKFPPLEERIILV